MKCSVNSGKRIFNSLLFFAGLLAICLPQRAPAQAEPCTKPKVAVKLTEIFDQVFEHLNKQYSPKTKEDWMMYIQEKVIEELRKNSPETQFIPGGGDECDYHFGYWLNLIGAGEAEDAKGLKVSKYTAYFMGSELVGTNACGFPGQVLGNKISKDDRDLDYTISRNVAAFGHIGDRIREYEQSHPVPPRGPRIDTSQSQEHVSPLEDEKSLDIKIDVKNCRGETVYDKYHGQKVILPRKTKRGEISPTKGFPQECLVTDNIVTLIIVDPAGASATYTLKRGTDPDSETVKLMTCGREKNEVKETKIEIQGLKIRSTPEDSQLCSGEQTNINVELFKVDMKGTQKPLASKKIQIEVMGLIDGKVMPQGDVITDENGRATLTYYAGDNDKRITCQAKYEPEDYPEFVQDKAIIEVEPSQPQSQATASIMFRCTTTYQKESSQSGEYSIVTDWEEWMTMAEVKVQASFEFDKSYVNEKLGEITEFYNVASWSISSSNATHDFRSEHEVRDSGKQVHADGLAEKKIQTFKATGKAEKSDREPLFLEIVIDKRTKKAKRVHFSGFYVEVTGEGEFKEDNTFGDVNWDPQQGVYSDFRNYSNSYEQKYRWNFPTVSNTIDKQGSGIFKGEEVTGGDGINQLSGGATEILKQDLLPGYEVVYYCNWQVSIKRQKKK